MRENRVKRILRAGGVPVGTMVFEFSTTGIARLAAAAGADFVIYDLEHTGWSMETIRMLLATSGSADLAPLVRVPATQYHFLARALDLGAAGLMVPMVESEEQARTIVDSAKYPPAGRRGTAFAVAHDDYADGDVAAKMRSANDETLLIAQIETAAGVENAAAIARVPGIDVLWVGQFDLTASLGIPGDFAHPRYLQALERVTGAAAQAGKRAGFMVRNAEEGRIYLRRGFGILAFWGDLWIYRQALADGLVALRSASGAAVRGPVP